MEKKDLLIASLLALFFIFLLVNTVQVTELVSVIDKQVEITKEKAKPGKIELIEIFPDCSDCYGIDLLINELKNQKIELISERKVDAFSDEAKSLINEFNLQKLPALIVLGETTKHNQTANFFKNNNFKLDDLNRAVFETVNSPYFDLESSTVKGRVSLVLITSSSCDDCASFDALINSLKSSGVVFSDEKVLEFSSLEAKEFIRKNNVQKVPAVFLSNDIKEYSAVATALVNQVGFKQGEEFLFFEMLSPPFIDTSNGEIKGLVKTILLKDDSCKDCYDTSIHKQIFERFGLSVLEEEIVDVSTERGQQLVTDYNISKVPTTLLSPEAKEYSDFVSVWEQVGTIEDTGWFVFRDPSVFEGVYKDLGLNRVVRTIVVLGSEFKFQPDSISVKEGELVKLHFVNAGQVEHDFVIDEFGVKTKLLKSRESETLEFVANKIGEFSFYSSIEDYKDKGMLGKIIISSLPEENADTSPEENTDTT